VPSVVFISKFRKSRAVAPRPPFHGTHIMKYRRYGQTLHIMPSARSLDMRIN
jgi:hypothetical protein